MQRFLKPVFILVVLKLVHSTSSDSYSNYYFPELKFVDKNVDPCDDFYQYSCGNFEQYHPRPEGQLLWDNFRILQQQIDTISTTILQAKIRQNDPLAVKKAKRMFTACANREFLEHLGLQPMARVIQDLNGWPMISYLENIHPTFSWETVGKLIGQYGIPLLFNWSVGPYIQNTEINMIMLSRDPLVLPASAVEDIDNIPRDFLQDYSENVDGLRGDTEPTPFVQFMTFVAEQMRQEMGSFVSQEQIDNGVQDVWQIMLNIKSYDKSPYDGVLSSEPIDTIGDLQKWSDSFSGEFKTRIDWLVFFNAAFSAAGTQVTLDTKIYVGNRNMTANLLTMVERSRPEVLMNFIVMRLMIYMTPDTNLEMWEQYNWLYDKLGYTVYSREQYCMRKVAGYPNMGLSMAIAHDYQNYYFSLKKMSQPREMINDLMSAFFELLQENDWMDDDAREWVVDKANKMVRLIGFPDYVFDHKKLDEYYATLNVCGRDHFGNAQKIRAFNLMKNFAEINKPRERNSWTQSPLYVNAFYNQMNNRITFPAGIMNPPFYTGGPSMVDYTRIGALIGHEITHGFDSKGRNTDATGNYAGNAFSEAVREAFSRKEDCFRRQYFAYHIEELGEYVNGNKTLSENIADNGGIREAYRAYQKLLSRLPFKQRPDTDYSVDQLFFISYGTMWCKIDTMQSLTATFKSDIHAPSKFRVIGTLANMQEFADAFQCPVGTRMNPRDKCVLW